MFKLYKTFLQGIEFDDGQSDLKYFLRDTGGYSKKTRDTSGGATYNWPDLPTCGKILRGHLESHLVVLVGVVEGHPLRQPYLQQQCGVL